MKFFLRFVAPILAILWLSRVSPLGAIVAVLLCVVRCCFSSRVFSHIFAHLVYDMLKRIVAGVAQLSSGRRRH